MTLHEISEAALNLPEQARWELAHQLLESLPEPPSVSDDELKELIATRVAAIEDGAMPTYESKDVLAQIRQQLREGSDRP